MKLNTVNGGSIELDDGVFALEYNESLIHQIVVSYANGRRSGTKSQKNRSAVSGGGIKPWRQKGTGRARAGTSRGPIWRKGGVTFAASSRSYDNKVNKKMYRAAMRSIFSELVRSGSLVVADVDVDSPSTKGVAQKLGSIGVSTNSLLVGVEDNKDLVLSVRNIPGCEYLTCRALDPVSLVSHDQVVLSVDAVKKVEEWLLC